MPNIGTFIREWTIGNWLHMEKPGVDAQILLLSKRNHIHHVVIRHLNLPHLHFHVQRDVFSNEFAIANREFVGKIFAAQTYWELKSILEPYIIGGCS